MESTHTTIERVALDMPNNKRIREAVSSFLEANMDGWRHKTYLSYKASMAKFEGYFKRNILVHSVEANDMSNLIWNDRFYDTAAPRPATKRKRYDHYKHFFNWCAGKTRRWCIDNPMDDVRVPTVDREIPPIPTWEEYEEFLARCPEPYRHINMLLGAIGSRVGEILRTGKDWTPPIFNRHERCILFPKSKTHKARRVPLPDDESLFSFVYRHADNNGHLDFMVTYQDHWKITKAVWRGMGKEEMSIKTLRTFATTMWLSKSKNPYLTAKTMGNSVRRIEQSYGHVLLEDQQEVANAVFRRSAI